MLYLFQDMDELSHNIILIYTDKTQPRKLRYDRRLSLPSLKCLHLYQCSISSIDQLFYLSIPNLLQLNLNNNYLQAIDGIGNLKNLMIRVVEMNLARLENSESILYYR